MSAQQKVQTPAGGEDGLAALQRAFGPRLHVVGPLRPSNRAVQRRRLAMVELTTTTPGQCQVELTGDGRVVRAWLDGQRVSATQFWQRFEAARRMAVSSRAQVRPRGPRRQRAAARARATPREAPVPPSGTGCCRGCEHVARVLEGLRREVRALQPTGARATTDRANRKPPSPQRRRPVAPKTVVPTELDRARARAALKRSGWKPVD